MSKSLYKSLSDTQYVDLLEEVRAMGISNEALVKISKSTYSVSLIFSLKYFIKDKTSYYCLIGKEDK